MGDVRQALCRGTPGKGDNWRVLRLLRVRASKHRVSNRASTYTRAGKVSTEGYWLEHLVPQFATIIAGSTAGHKQPAHLPIATHCRQQHKAGPAAAAATIAAATGQSGTWTAGHWRPGLGTHHGGAAGQRRTSTAPAAQAADQWRPGLALHHQWPASATNTPHAHGSAGRRQRSAAARSATATAGHWRPR